MKIDSQEIIDFLDNLATQPWLGRLRSKWVNYLFHFSELANAVEILRSERVFCRAHLEASGQLPVDIASSDIISQTDDEVKKFVRLYFRPRTPTQYHMEGFRPTKFLSKNSHCRVPVFFLFDSRRILCADDTRFSDVNLAIHGQSKGLGFTAADLAALNFRQIYSTGPIPAEGRSATVRHRNAEVVVPHQLELSALRAICCRSRAEKETLLYLLPQDVAHKWASRVYVNPTLFERSWVYVENVNLSRNRAVFEFSPDAEQGGPFKANIAVLAGGNSFDRTRENFIGNGKIALPMPIELPSYSIELRLDGHVAFGSTYDEMNIPF